MRSRRIALCVGVWSSRENHYAWTFTKKRLLQDPPRPTVEDKLFVVHVKRPKDPVLWQRGGPALPDVTSALEGLSHNIVELEGDTVSELVKFAHEKEINILILGAKGRNRVKRTVNKGTTVRVVQQAPCACVIVGPKLSCGEHFRIQAARKPEGVGSVTQFRRRVAIILNAGPFDPNMVQYTARNILRAGDRVIIVRCMSKEVLKRSSKQQPEQERDNVREIGRNKLRGAEGVAMAVEVLKGGLKMIVNFIESKGIDLVVMARGQRPLVRRSLSAIGAGPTLSALYHRCPCPCMVVPMGCLQYDWSSSSRSSAASSQRDPLSSAPQSRINALGRQVSTPITARLRNFGARQGNLRSAMASKSSPHLRVVPGGGQCPQSATIDNAHIGQQPRGAGIGGDSTLSLLEVIRDEEIELEAIEELDLGDATPLGKHGNPEGDEEEEGQDEEKMTGQLTPATPAHQIEFSTGLEDSRSLMVGSPPPSRPSRVIRRLDSSRSEGSLDFNVSPRAVGEVVNSLKQQLAEKDQEILLLKEQISKLTLTPRNE